MEEINVTKKIYKTVEKFMKIKTLEQELISGFSKEYSNGTH